MLSEDKNFRRGYVQIYPSEDFPEERANLQIFMPPGDSTQATEKIHSWSEVSGKTPLTVEYTGVEYVMHAASPRALFRKIAVAAIGAPYNTDITITLGNQNRPVLRATARRFGTMLDIRDVQFAPA
ncbi:MAG: hypothetical protein AB7H77_03695 [Bdellovibrionales bacterium]